MINAEISEGINTDPDQGTYTLLAVKKVSRTFYELVPVKRNTTGELHKVSEGEESEGKESEEVRPSEEESEEEEGEKGESEEEESDGK